MTDNYYVAPDEATKGTFTVDGTTQTQEFVPRSDAPAVGKSWTDARGVTTTIEPDGAGAGTVIPTK